MKKIWMYLMAVMVVGCVALGMTGEVSAATVKQNIKIKETYNDIGGVTVVWKNSEPADGYVVYRSLNGGTYKKYDTVTTKKFVDAYTETGQKYQYRIQAYRYKKNEKKYSKQSEESDAIVANPCGVTDLKGAHFEDYNVLYWTVNPYLSGYRIYRKKGSGAWKLIDTLDIAEVKTGVYEDYTIAESGSYRYKITAFEIVNEKEYTSKTSAEFKPGTAKGIDVSYHNGRIDWKQVRDAGISFAIIRIGYGTEKGGIIDSKFAYNYKMAKKYGIRVGIYLYSYADNKTEARNEAKFTIKVLSKYEKLYGDIDLPVSFDFENSYRNKRSYRDANTKIIMAYCDYMENEGYDTSVYSFLKFFRDATHVKQISKYGLWLARWTFSAKSYNSFGLKNVQLWQYSDRGRIVGIPEAVDLNLNIQGN